MLSFKLKKQTSKNVADTAFTVTQVKQKPVVLPGNFLGFYIFPDYKNNMLLVILFTINAFTSITQFYIF